MNYYKPTSTLEKIQKILQLQWLYRRAKKGKSRRKSTSTSLSILMVVPQLDRSGGYERQALQLSKSLTQSGCLVTVLTDSTAGRQMKEFRSGFVIFRMPSSLALLLFLIRYRNRYDCAHAHGITGFSLFVLRVSKLLGKATVLKQATRGDLEAIMKKPGLKHRSYRKWLKSIDRFIAISNEVRQEAVTNHMDESRIRSIPNLVDTDWFFAASPAQKEEIRLDLSIDSSMLVFLYIGRLEDRKGVAVLLEAWQKISTGLLLIVGTGSEESRLRALSHSLTLRNIRFCGATTDPRRFYQASDILVLPSIFEGMPNVLLEGMSCGLPSIATRIGGVVDVICDRNDGLLVAPGSAIELAAAMQSYAEDPVLRKTCAQKALKKAREKYDQSVVTPQYMQLYREVCAKKL